MDKDKEKDLEVPGLVFGFIVLLVVIFTMIADRGEENVFLWFIGTGLALAIAFFLSAGVYGLIYSFAHEVLSNRSKPIIIVGVIIIVATLVLTSTNTFGDETLLQHIQNNQYPE